MHIPMVENCNYEQEGTIIFLLKKKYFGMIVLLYPIILQSASLPGNDLPVPEFAASEDVVSTAGHVRLSWDVPDNAENLAAIEFELQQTSDVAFQKAKTIYSGPDRSSFISGLPNGDYRFRVRARLDGEAGGWSTPVTVQVQHQSLRLAFTLLGLGAIVVLATVTLVIVGNRKANIE